MTTEVGRRPSSMDIDSSQSPVQLAIPDGALGDDERTETDRSPHEQGSPGDDMEECPGERGGEDVECPLNGRSKKKHRRGKAKGGKHHRKWKPYTKMTWQERKEQEEFETKRACMKREERFASGHPVAPYNTTQFLMEDHQPGEPDLDFDRPGNGGGQPRRSTANNCEGSESPASDDYYDSPNDEEIFLEKDFTEAYENFHAERLQAMTKDELIRDYLELESRVEKLEMKLKDIERPLAAKDNINNTKASLLMSEEGKVDVNTTKRLEAEIRRLREANEKLQKENSNLKVPVRLQP